MNLKKTTLLVALLLGGSLFAGAKFSNIVVNLNSGGKTVVSIDSSLHAGFSETEMLFKSNTVDIAIARSEIKDFSIEKDAGVSSPTAELGVSFAVDALSFSNLPQNSSIRIYNAAGIMFLSDTASGSYRISTSKLPKGVNLVKVNNLTYKVNIK